MFKKFIQYLVAGLLTIALWFRYKIKVVGLENLNAQTLNKPGGVLFLPNHPAIFVDPVSITLALFPKFPLRPMIVEYMYYYPFVNTLMHAMDALPIPDFDITSNSLKRKQSEKVISEVIKSLRTSKQNFLIYPAGRIKHTAYESIGGASGVHRILQEAPEANVVLVRIKGLWGSKFSRAFGGVKPLMFPTLKWGFIQVLKNLLFFSPRRKITIEFVPAPKDFPYHGTRLELNQYLERWFNKPDGLSPQIGEYPGDSLILVPNSMWNHEMPSIHEPPELRKHRHTDISKVPRGIQEKVISKIALMTDNVPSSIKPQMSLSNDLGMDSLDTSELAIYLHEQFEIPYVPVTELTTVGQVMGIAAKQIVWKETAKFDITDFSKWYKPLPHVRTTMGPGETIPEIFLNLCENTPNQTVCADGRLGILTYNELKLRSIVLARHMRKLPGQHIGVLLPSCVAAIVCVLAIQLAGKVPVMVNWTVGPRHLETVVKLSGAKTVLTSWAFLDRLEGVDLTPIEDRLVMLEDLGREIGIFDKLKGYFLAKKSPKAILKALNPKGSTPDSEAVLLFTSGTENMPKGVALTYRNILSNQRAVVRDTSYSKMMCSMASCRLSTVLALLSAAFCPFWRACVWLFTPIRPMEKRLQKDLKSGALPSCVVHPHSLKVFSNLPLRSS